MKLFKAMATIGGLTFLSRIAGFIRDVLTAAILGAGPVADAFFVALKLPNFFRRISAEGAFSASFVPMFSSEAEKQGKEEALKFAAEAQSMMLSIITPFTILMILVMPWVIYGIAPGFTDDGVRYDLAVTLSRVTFPYILTMSLVALMGGVLNSFNKFAPFAIVPVLFNLCLILALVFLSPILETPGHAMAWGVAAAGIAQLLFMIYAVRRAGLKIRIQRPRMTPRIKKLFKLMGPGIIGAGVVQINLFVDMVLASTLPTGAISYLYYADRLYQLPLSIIGIAIGTALLPMLSRSLSANRQEESSSLMSQSIEMGLMLALPAAVALFVIPAPILQVLFERGEFNNTATLASAYALMAYAVGLPAFVLIKIFSTAYFANKDTKTPVKFVMIGAVINIVLGIILIFPFAHIGIAMATAIAAWVNFTLLYLGMKQKIELKTKAIGFIILSACVMGAVLYGILTYCISDIGFVSLSLLIASGGFTYAAMLFVFKVITPAKLKTLLKRA